MRYRGALGSGLAIFTRFPIISAEAFPYSLSGVPYHPVDGDFFVNKAAGNVVILHPLLGEVEVWNTHVSAPEARRSSNTIVKECKGIAATDRRRTDPLDACRWREPARYETGPPDSSVMAVGKCHPEWSSQRTLYPCRGSSTSSTETNLADTDVRWAISTLNHPLSLSRSCDPTPTYPTLSTTPTPELTLAIRYCPTKLFAKRA